MTIDGRAVRGDTTRRLVLDTALEMFGEQGYRGTSVRDIAARCGMTHPGLLYHFPSKAELLMAVLQRRDEADCDDEDFDHLAGRAMLMHLVEGARQNATKRGIVELFATLSVEATAPGHPAHDYFVDRYQELRSKITTAVTELGHQGELREGVVPATAAALVIAAMDGLQIQWLLDPDAIDMPGALAALMNSFLVTPLAG